MKVGVISDSHKKVGRTERALELLIKNGVKYLIHAGHAGDIVKLEVLELLRESAIPYIAVLGNNDYHLVEHTTEFNLVQEPHYFKIKDTKFKLMHIPYYLTPDADIIIYGHTHTFEVDYKNRTLFLNSGEVCARNKDLSECAMIEISDKSYVVNYYSRIIKSDNWNKKEFVYERGV